MRKTKRVASILAAALMTVCISVMPYTGVTVKAAGTNSITINGVSITSAHTFELYQIMTGTYTPGAASDMHWGNGISQYKTSGSISVPINDGDVVDPVILYEIAETADTNEAKSALISRLTLNDANKTSVNSLNGKANFSNLDTGYYLIKDVTTGLSGDDSVSSDILLYVDGAESVNIKTVKPSFDKEVSTDGTTDSWAEVADYNIGDSIKFKLTATIPYSENLTAYSAYKIVFTDTYSSGITFESIDSVTCKVGTGEAATIEAYVAETAINGYKLTQTPGEGNKTGFTLELSNIIENVGAGNWGTAGNDIVVTVIYTGKLNNSAPAIAETTANAEYAVATSVTTNGGSVSYSNNPALAESMGNTAVDSVGIFTYKMENTKYANIATSGYELNGAKFTLHRDTAEGTVVSMIYDAGLSAYRPVIGVETAVDYMISGYGVDDSGKLNIVGLDAGTYVLVEDEAPSGYEKIPNKEFTISAVLSEASDGTSATATLSLTGLDGLSGNEIIDTLTSNKDLPSTGGIGTTIFYIVGSIMVGGAGIVLITKKRMGADRI